MKSLDEILKLAQNVQEQMGQAQDAEGGAVGDGQEAPEALVPGPTRQQDAVDGFVDQGPVGRGDEKHGQDQPGFPGK